MCRDVDDARDGVEQVNGELLRIAFLGLGRSSLCDLGRMSSGGAVCGRRCRRCGSGSRRSSCRRCSSNRWRGRLLSLVLLSDLRPSGFRRARLWRCRLGGGRRCCGSGCCCMFGRLFARSRLGRERALRLTAGACGSHWRRRRRRNSNCLRGGNGLRRSRSSS